MGWIALRMLAGDRVRYGVGVLGVAFAALLIGHQLSVYLGVMDRTCSLIRDAHPEGIWVMDPGVLNLEDARRMPASALYRVRGVDGVAWAVPLFKGPALVHTEAGRYRLALLVGLDDATLTGLPGGLSTGLATGLRAPDAVCVDEAGCQYLWPGRVPPLGAELKVNGRRATLAGVCRASPPFLSTPVIYTRIGNAPRYCSEEPGRVSFVLVGHDPRANPREVCRRIARQTGLLALTGAEFAERTRGFFRANTAIVYNFALVVGLGFVVGAAVAGQMFYLFLIQHLRDFAGLKAMGATRPGLARMVLLQTAVVWAQGYGLGVGAAAMVLETTGRGAPFLAGFELRGPGVVGAGAATLLIMATAGLLGMRRVLRTEPAVMLN